ncbi:MAG TPA: FecR domain-containing protein [Ohtaekwangia sp.]|uniref:FecR domain-containing protein n=1 Tax=Ohtaekwangia sp. TaxID=2066019 RepID=UPI002F9567D7
MERIKQVYRVLSGEAQPAEKEDLQQWIDADPLNREEYMNIKLLWENSALHASSSTELRRGFREIKRRIGVRTSRRPIEALTMLVMISLFTAFVALSVYISFVLTAKQPPVQMQFEAVALGQVCKTMEQSYGIKISMPSQLAGCKFSGSFYNEPTEKAIASLTKNLGITFRKIDSKSYLISGHNCQ